MLEQRRLSLENCFGIALLLVVNVLWVASAELTRYIYEHENFRRPFFTTYFKTCMFTLYMLRVVLRRSSSRCRREKIVYEKLENKADAEEEMEMEARNEADESDFEIEKLSVPTFESVAITSDLESDAEASRRAVRFARMREVRLLPASESALASNARMPYRPPWCPIWLRNASPIVKLAMVFAPLWLLSNVAFQAALLTAPVGFVNLCSSTSSLFLLMIIAMFPDRASDACTLTKLLLVLCNIFGVGLLSEFSNSLSAIVLSLLSALGYAIYLIIMKKYQRRYRDIDMPLLFGLLGVISLSAGSVMMMAVHLTGIEPQTIPTNRQLTLVMLNGLLGTVVSDYLWLWGSLMAGALTASLSLSLSVPLSLVADAMLRAEMPNKIELIAAIPILMAFIGSALLAESEEEQCEEAGHDHGPDP